MHKTLHTFLLTILLLSGSNILYSQNYHEDDKEGLRKILRQNSSSAAKLNLECLGLAVADTANWHNSEEWIMKIQATVGEVFIDWEWDNGFPNRITRLEFYSMGEENKRTTLSGELDCSFFSDLRQLNCEGQRFTDIYLNKCFSLEELNITGNKINRIDLSDNRFLGIFQCSDNLIKELNLTGNQNLRTLDCSNNLIERLDVTNQIHLISLSCANNKIDKLNLVNNQKLERLDCSNNNMTDVTLSENKNLQFLSTSGNVFNTGLNLNANKEIKNLYAADNQLSDLNTSHLYNLSLLYCPANNLSDLNTSQNTRLEYLYCFGNNLSEINLSNNGKIKYLHCADNRISRIESPINLSFINCLNNNLKLSSLLLAPQSDHGYFLAHPQRDIDFGEVFSDSEIDLSEEYEIYGNISDFRWYDEGNEELILPISENGKFIVDREIIDSDQVIYCDISNSSFPGLSVKFKFNVSVKSVDNIEDGLSNPRIKLYPSYVVDVLNIESDKLIDHIGIYDVSGRNILSVNEDMNKHEISMSDFPSGIYIVKIKTETGKQIIRKIKKK